MANVDIIIPLYNKEQTVARSVNSVLNQSYTDWRLIIVDDGSTDNSLAVVKAFADPRIFILTQENRGPGAARNRGIQQADSEYVAFLDADDQWHPFYLKNAMEAFDRTSAVFVGTLYEEWPDQTDMSGFWAKRGVVPGTYMFSGNEKSADALSFLFFFHVGNTVVNTEVARQCGGFYDTEKCLLGEDTVFFARLIFYRKFAIIGPVAVRHNRQHSELSTVKNRPLDIFLKHPDIVTDFYPAAQKSFIRRILAWHALRTAHFRVRQGQKDDAVFLRTQFSDMRKYRFFYALLCVELAVSRWLPYWVKFKCRVGPPTRRFLAKAIKSFDVSDNQQ